MPPEEKEGAVRRLIMLLLGSVMLLGVTAGPAGAITGGRPDGTAHPYVGFVGEPEVASAPAPCCHPPCS